MYRTLHSNTRTIRQRCGTTPTALNGSCTQSFVQQRGGNVSFSATVRRLLISCPGDVPPEDLRIIHQAINRWNGIYGETFASIVVPISWGTHAAAEFGRPAQEILNDRLVDTCDICVAIFANRMGTRTEVAESGTAEEISRLHEASRYVAVLRSRRPIDPGTIDRDQAARLDDYMAAIRSTALVMEYRTDSELEQHIGNILSSSATHDRMRQQSQIPVTETTALEDRADIAEVWPRIDSTERPTSDSQGRVRIQRSWYLTLSNSGPAPARNVQFMFEQPDDRPGIVWKVLGSGDDDNVILPPNGGSIRFPLIVTLGSTDQALCNVRWEDARGEQQSAATLRIT